MAQITTPADAVRRYRAGRTDLLVFLVASLVNIFFIVFLNSYFYFSSYFSQLIPSVTAGIYEELPSPVVWIVGAFLTLLFLVPYLLCWIFSKNRSGWLIAALVLISIELLPMLLDLLLSSETGALLNNGFNILFHIWMIVSLAKAIRAKKLLSSLPEEAPIAPETEPQTDDAN